VVAITGKDLKVAIGACARYYSVVVDAGGNKAVISQAVCKTDMEHPHVKIFKDSISCGESMSKFSQIPSPVGDLCQNFQEFHLLCKAPPN